MARGGGVAEPFEQAVVFAGVPSPDRSNIVLNTW